ncbi:MAG: hypothetical protein DRJ46_04245 [Thermoprotei archaeon]|nr:MAG: hypothetical protein DRJ46_04245 [Thermoprotei archaeon]
MKVWGVYLLYCNSTETPLKIELYKLVNGSWARLPVEVVSEGESRASDEDDYRYVVEQKFGYEVLEYTSGKYKVVVTSIFIFKTLIRVLEFEVVRKYQEVVYYPYSVLDVDKVQEGYSS